jgi:Leucine-rich repeat (LRR) protein
MKKYLFFIVVFLLLFVSNCQHTPASLPTPAPPQSPAPTGVKAVAFLDENLEAAVRNALFIEGIRVKDEALLNKPLDEEITTAELAKLTRMEAVSKNITDISGLEYCGNLTYLNLVENKITDISPLTSLTNLITLNLGANQISDISPLSSLINLTELDLFKNQLSDISPLSSLTNLTGLYLFRNQISNISPLSSLTNLSELDLYANTISDISPLLENDGLGAGDLVRLEGNNLELWEGSNDMENIKTLKNRGVVVLHDPLQSTP